MVVEETSGVEETIFLEVRGLEGAVVEEMEVDGVVVAEVRVEEVLAMVSGEGEMVAKVRAGSSKLEV